MRSRARVVLTALTLAAWSLGAPSSARAQASGPSAPPPAVTPPGPPPVAEPPPPPPPQAQPAAPPEATPTNGQWVYTQQYGWVWMSYGDAYTYVPPGGSGEPLAYVYYPSQGWTWVVAPWVWGVGPWPSFGGAGPARFAWYAHGWWRTPSRWNYRPAPLPERPGPQRELHARGVRPAPARGERHAARGEHRR